MFKKIFIWLFTGYPLHLAGISAGTAVAVAAAAASAAGAAANASAAKKGAKAQGQAADKANTISQEATDKANELARIQYEQDIARQTEQLGYAQNRLTPYAQAGVQSLDALTSGMSAPHGEIQGRSASGTTPEMAAQVTAWQQQASQAASDNTRFIQEAQQRGDFGEVQRLQAQDAILQANAQKAQQAMSGVKPYDAGQQYQAESPNGGELYRSFSSSDYANDPTIGSNYNPASFAKGTAAGAKFTPENIKLWLSDHKGASDSEIAAAMKQYGISAQQMAAATGQNVNDINNRLAKTKDLSTARAPDLTKNFNEASWFKQQGVPQNALTQNFDRTGYLAKAGFTEADLARKFTANDFKVDPGYQFRLQQGAQGIENSAAASGGQLSGATMKALARYNQDFGSNEYGNVFNRFQSTQQNAQNALGGAQNAFNQDRQNLSGQFTDAYNRFGLNRDNARTVYNDAYNRWNEGRTNTFNRLAHLASGGQNAATNQGNWGMNYAGNTSAASQNYSQRVGANYMGNAQTQGENTIGKGNAQAGGYIGRTNAINSGLEGVSNGISQYNAYKTAQNNFNTQMANDRYNTNQLVSALRR